LIEPIRLNDARVALQKKLRASINVIDSAPSIEHKNIGDLKSLSADYFEL